MSDENEQNEEAIALDSASNGAGKVAKSKPAKVLPTDRCGFEKQLGILRGYAVASGAERKSVSNKEVSAIVGIHDGTISNCNPFFSDIGFIERDGYKNRPTEAVFSYANSFEWEPATAAAKLAAVLETSWAATALLPRLAFRPMSRDEAITVLADAAKASKDYKVQLEYVLEYLRVAGLVVVDNNTVTATPRSRPDTTQHGEEQKKKEVQRPPTGNELHDGDPRSERFHIPIPGKPSALVVVPRDLTTDDWDMLQVMLQAYIKRLQTVAGRTASAQADDEDK
jgi:hypothetical protein